ncbi:MAG: lysophospholipid acyltransferase family protein [Paracoccaceae bacterium]|jgi:1-acyl-sn-glycerol-3-phosphate acyltransferase|nr:lysophospholipid acyltransferase family protein [Paracoccaceae bacterium]
MSVTGEMPEVAPGPDAGGFRGPTWIGTDPLPEPRRLGPLDWARVAVRAFALLVVLFGGMAVLLAIRLVEAPLAGLRRPVTAHIPQIAFVAACRIVGLRRTVRGRPIEGVGAAVANHASWLDIFALGASDRVIFVAKAEVARWPGIGWLARGAGTLFFRRDRAEAVQQAAELVERIALGQRPLFFPEGTSSDGARVLRFKPTLFASLLDPRVKGAAQVQPITVEYEAPPGLDPRVYAWWGDMDFAPHFLQVLALPRQGRVTVTYHPPRRVSDMADRKALAAACEDDVRAGLGGAGFGRETG